MVWLSLGYLMISLIFNVLAVFQNAEYFLTSGMGNMAALILNIAICVLVIMTFNAIRTRSEMGRKLAVKMFIVLVFFAVLNGVVILGWLPENAGIGLETLLIVIVVGGSRVLFCCMFAVYFAFSKGAKNYFAR